jgi:cytochrome b pre-mRNA-processing protein 3
MLGFLFRSLTADSARGAALFDSVTGVARLPHWYVQGRVPDTIDGRFAALTTVTALVLVRLERANESGRALSVALTERFIEVMESEHRELGLGDPTLGKTVRKLVGTLARRTELWRSATDGETAWREAVVQSLYKDVPPPDALEHSGKGLKMLWDGLQQTDLRSLEEGKLR